MAHLYLSSQTHEKICCSETSESFWLEMVSEVIEDLVHFSCRNSGLISCQSACQMLWFAEFFPALCNLVHLSLQFSLLKQEVTLVLNAARFWKLPFELISASLHFLCALLILKNYSFYVHYNFIWEPPSIILHWLLSNLAESDISSDAICQ